MDGMHPGGGSASFGGAYEGGAQQQQEQQQQHNGLRVKVPARGAEGAAAELTGDNASQSFVLADGREVVVTYDDEGMPRMEVAAAAPSMWTPRKRAGGSSAFREVMRSGGGGKVLRNPNDDASLCHKSLNYFTQSHPLRQFCIRVWRNPNFEVLIMLLIFANCVTLALYDPTMPEGEGKFNKAAEQSEIVFTVLFTMEFALKVIAMGLALAPNTYFRDGWNAMDGIIVIFSLLGFIVPAANISSVRTARVLRPLRSISVLPGMRILVSTLLNAMPAIGNVMLLCAFLFFVFGILGVQLFEGALRNRCVAPDPGTGQFTQVVDMDAICTNATYPWHGPHCDEGHVCMDWSDLKVELEGDTYHGYEIGPNPNYDITHFDDFLFATLAMFQSITLEGWTPIMYNCMDGTSGWSFIYFTLLIFFGSFFVLNLALAVVSEMLDETAKEITSEMYEEEENAKADEEQGGGDDGEAAALEDGTADDGAEMEPDRRNILQKAASAAAGVAGAVGESIMSAAETVGLGAIDDDDPAQRLSIRGICRGIIDYKYFSPFVTAIILLNTVILAVEYDGMSESTTDALDQVNIGFAIFFIVEMVVKVLGLGLKEYAADRFNLFDAFVVGLSIIELASAGGGSLSALRAFRILRVLKLVRSWVSLQKFLVTVYRTVTELGNLCFVVLLIIFIYALLGMRLFGDQMNDLPGGRPRHHFDTLLWAMITVFQVLTGEDWNAIMYDCMHATSGAASMYFVTLLIFGNFLIVNLFIGILLANFGEEVVDDPDIDPEELEHKEEQERKQKEKKEKEKELKKFRAEAVKADPNPYAGNAICRLSELEHKSLGLFETTSGVRTMAYRIVDDKRFEYAIMCLIAISSGVMAYEAPSVTANADTREILDAIDATFAAIFCLEMALKLVALGGFKGPYAYVKDGWNVLDGTIVIFAVIGIALKDLNLGWVRALRALRALRPLRAISRIPELKVVVNALIASFPGMGNVIVICLLFWFIFGILGMNLFMGKFHYCTDGDVLTKEECTGVVCEVDCEVVPECAALPDGGLSLHDFDALRALAANDTLFPGAELNASNPLVESLAREWANNVTSPPAASATVADPADANATSDDDAASPPPPSAEAYALARTLQFGDCAEAFSSCEAVSCADREWENYDMNFDNLGQAMQTLFEMSTTEGWTAVMYQGVDAVGIDHGPIEYYNEPVTAYFLIFMVIGSFFLLNLFVGIILDNFARLRAESETGSVFLTSRQKAWVDAARLAFSQAAEAEPEPPEHPTRKMFFDVVSDVRFEYAVLGAILCNTIVMAMNHYDMSDDFVTILEILNYLFTAFFTLEAGAKIIGLGFGGYLANHWNKFDFVVVLASWVGIIAGSGGSISAIRIFRIARVFRLVRRLKTLRTMFTTLLVALPTLVNVFMLVLLIFFVFAVLGVNMFGTVEEGECVDKHANFSTFGKSMLLLFRSSTGEAWNCIMYDVMVSGDKCDSTEIKDEHGNILKHNNCGSPIAPIYFVLFVLIGSFLMLNLLIAVVLENFSANTKADELEINKDTIDDFKDVWKRFDPRATNFIKVHELEALVRATPKPLGLAGTDPTRKEMAIFLAKLKLPAGDYLLFQDVIRALSLAAIGVNDNELPSEIRKSLEVQANRQRNDLVATAEESGHVKDVRGKAAMLDMKPGELYALQLAQSWVKGWIERKRRKKEEEKRREEGLASADRRAAEHVMALLERARAEFNSTSGAAAGSMGFDAVASPPASALARAGVEAHMAGLLSKGYEQRAGIGDAADAPAADPDVGVLGQGWGGEGAASGGGAELPQMGGFSSTNPTFDGR